MPSNKVGNTVCFCILDTAHIIFLLALGAFLRARFAKQIEVSASPRRDHRIPLIPIRHLMADIIY